MFGAVPYILIGLGVVVLVAGTLYTMRIVQREQAQVVDKGADPAARARHPFTANPILVLYIIIPVAAIVGGVIWVVSSQQNG